MSIHEDALRDLANNGYPFCDLVADELADADRAYALLFSANAKLRKDIEERDETLAAILHPENQPSQYGTVTLEYHNAQIAALKGHAEAMHEAAKKVLLAREAEANAKRACDVASDNFTDSRRETNALQSALIAASNADKAMIDAISAYRAAYPKE